MANWHRLGRTRNCPAGIARYLIDGDTLYIWFAGTETRTEWRDNFRTGTIYYEGRRVNAADHAQAVEVMIALAEAGVDLPAFHVVRCVGISRGFSVATQAAMIIFSIVSGRVQLLGFAGKRTIRKDKTETVAMEVCFYNHMAYRGDIVPFLPPWYESMPTQWVGPCSWPWTAHIRAAKAAAKWRHDVTKGGEL